MWYLKIEVIITLMYTYFSQFTEENLTTDTNIYDFFDKPDD